MPRFDLATPLNAAIALVSLLLTCRLGVKVAPTAHISINILVNPLGSEASLCSIVQVPIDLLWAPVLTDHLFNLRPYSTQNTSAGNFSLS
jgi:hypothetical protein